MNVSRCIAFTCAARPPRANPRSGAYLGKEEHEALNLLRSRRRTFWWIEEDCFEEEDRIEVVRRQGAGFEEGFREKGCRKEDFREEDHREKGFGQEVGFEEEDHRPKGGLQESTLCEGRLQKSRGTQGHDAEEGRRQARVRLGLEGVCVEVCPERCGHEEDGQENSEEESLSEVDGGRSG